MPPVVWSAGRGPLPVGVGMYNRDLDEPTHRELVRRADAAGMSLRAYVIEVLRRSPRGAAVAVGMRGTTLAAPAHLDAEVLSALCATARGVSRGHHRSRVVGGPGGRRRRGGLTIDPQLPTRRVRRSGSAGRADHVHRRCECADLPPLAGETLARAWRVTSGPVALLVGTELRDRIAGDHRRSVRPRGRRPSLREQRGVLPEVGAGPEP